MPLLQVLCVNPTLQHEQSCKSKFSLNQPRRRLHVPPTPGSSLKGPPKGLSTMLLPLESSPVSVLSPRAVGKEPGPRVSGGVRIGSWQVGRGPTRVSEPTLLHCPACGSPRATYLCVYGFQQNIKWKSRYYMGARQSRR